MKKSYLSRQMIAVIVIATILLVSVPLYFFVLVPFIERGNKVNETGAAYIEGEIISGSSIRIANVLEAEKATQDFTLGKGSYSWTFRVDGSYISVVGYENTPYDENMYYLRNAVSKLSASERVLPTQEELTQMREEKAAKLSEAELEALGGLGKLAISEKDLADYEIDWAAYGLDDTSELNYCTVTDRENVTHKLYIGGVAPDGTSRYAMYEGRNAVYLLSNAVADYMCMTAVQMARPLVLLVPDDAESNYTPDSFVVYRNDVKDPGEPYVRIERLTADQALMMDKATTSVLVEYIGEPGKEEPTAEDYNYYNSSSAYMQMLYDFFRTALVGEEVLEITPSYPEIQGGNKIYKQKEMATEILEKYFISKENPYRSFYYSKDTGDGPMINLVVFSTPQSDEGGTFFYVYNASYEMIVKLYEADLPTIGASNPVSFLEAAQSDYLNRYVSMLPIDNLGSVTIDSTKLPSNYAELMPAIKSTLKLKFQLNAVGEDRVLDEDGVPILESVSADGSKLKDPDGTNGVENFRQLYARLLSIRMYTNVDKVLDQINATDLEKPHVTVTYQVYEGETHTLKFYMFDPSGNYAFYTYDGHGKYVVYREDITEMLEALKLVLAGESVLEELGEAF